ncbi:MAG: HAMP domain-containing protein [Burkholderiales bacterium]|jgi:two-component system, NarL family, sensor histidine kinase UhpB|nr:MAG: HAMP domain-containing protein [Burkholderiales bacterium]
MKPEVSTARSAEARSAWPVRWPFPWSITTRLVMIACVPAVLMFVVITAALYVIGKDDAIRAVRDRGELIALSLAQTGQYGLVSGNGASLERSIRRLLESDHSIESIQLTDAGGHVVASVGAGNRPDSLVFVKDVRADVFTIDLLDNSSASPHGGESTTREGRVIGKVTVRMTSDTIMQEWFRRVAYGAGAVLLAACVSVVAGLTLAQRLREPLREAMGALREIRQGRYEVRLPARASGEIGELQATINEMAQGLSEWGEKLQLTVDQRTADLQDAVAKAHTADAERGRLLARSNKQLEDERKRIAVEIHDHLNASLIGLRSKAQHIADVSAGMEGGPAREVNATATEITSTIARLYQNARDLIKQLRPEVIDVLGLTGALQEMTREYNQLVPVIRFVLHVSPGFPPLRGQVAIVAYRLVQEALSNVVKHSSASRVEVSLAAPDAMAEILIAVLDDGVGFDPSKIASGSLGLAGMRERVAGAGGRMRIRSKLGRGTRVTFRLPVLEPDEPPR